MMTNPEFVYLQNPGRIQCMLQQRANDILQVHGAENILQQIKKETPASCNFKELKASCKTTRSQRHPATSRS